MGLGLSPAARIKKKTSQASETETKTFQVGLSQAAGVKKKTFRVSEVRAIERSRDSGYQGFGASQAARIKKKTFWVSRFRAIADSRDYEKDVPGMRVQGRRRQQGSRKSFSEYQGLGPSQAARIKKKMFWVSGFRVVAGSRD